MYRDLPVSELHDTRPIGLDDRWGLIGSFFAAQGFVQQQIDSMNHFMTTDLPAIITQTPPIRLYPSKDRFQSRHMKRRRYFYEITFDSVHLGKPMITDENNNSVPLFPQDARERDLNYSAALYARATTRRIESDGDEGIRETIKREWAYLGQFPIMVGSDHCWLADETLDRDVAQMRECLYDQGAYFIGRGREKVLVAQEHIRFNRIFVFEKRRPTGVVLVCELRSCYNSHLRNVHPVSITIQGTRISELGLRTTTGVPMNVRIPYANQPISVPVIFKALGVLEDRDILYCVAQCERDDEIAALLRRPLEEAAHLKTREDALYVLGKCLNIPNRNTKDPRAGRIALALRSMSRVFLPHMSSNLDNTYEERMNKALFFGHQVRKLFAVYLGRTASANDRDHYTNKRIDMAGSLFGLLFTQNFQKMKKEARKHLERCIDHGKPFDLSQAIKSKTITQGLRYALATGKWPNYQVVKINAGVSQELNRMTFGATLSHLRRVNTPIDKKTGKLTKPRELHATQQFLLCAVETPEGAPCGVLKNFALMCAVSVGVDDGPVLDVIRGSPHVQLPMKLLDRAWVARVNAPEWHKIFLNGEWVGLVPDAHALAAELRTLRRQGDLSSEMSVAHRSDMRELHISTEGGRPMHPALVVQRDKDGLFELALRKKHVAKLKYSAVTNYGWSDLLDDGVVEWLDCEELEECMMAMDPSDLVKQNQLMRENRWLTEGNRQEAINIVAYTHCEIHPATQLGVCGSIIPFADHNQSPRNVYQCAMGKQALGIATTNYHYRFDSIANLLYYPQRPLVTTRINEIMRSSELPSGQNIMVAIMCGDGYDIEDATIMNQSSVDRGLFRSTQLRTYYEEAKKNHAHGKETFENPKKDTETDITDMQQGNYDKLSESGVVLPGARVAEHDIIIAKTITPKVNNYRRKTRQNALGAVLGQDEGVEEERKKRDKSVVVGKNEDGIVDRILKTVTPKVETIKLRTRQMRIPEIGDKFSSRHGQKGTVGRMVRAEDMPYTAQGMTPDLIINPHAFTSRMTVGHTADMLFGKLAAATGRQQDGTVFDHQSVEAAAEALHRCRYQRYGNEVMYDGCTGEKLAGTVFFCPIYYQRLKHMVQDKVHARARGATRMMTRQPTVGRRREGGFRFGEMERDCMIAHGGAANLRERLFTQSDPYTTYVCAKCGQIAIHNTKTDDRWCNQCQTHNTTVVPVSMPYAFKLLKQELLAMNIAARLVVPQTQQPDSHEYE